MQTTHFASYADLIAHLDQLGLFHINPNLSNVKAVLTRLTLTRPPFAVAQVVGTNGKGSTSTLLASLAQHHGLKTGFFCSPHFITPRERIRINGQKLSEDQWLGYANQVMAAEGDKLTYFELLTVLGMVAFAAEGVQVAVIEAGLGGTWDSTTAITADMLVVTPIALDHTQVLGPTIADIAKDKAGAIRPHTPVVSALQETLVTKVLTEAAALQDAPITWTGHTLALPENITQKAYLRGAYMQRNMALALNAFEVLRGILPSTPCSSQEPLPTDRELTVKALVTAWIPGRMQRTKARPCSQEHPGFPAISGWPPCILDGAHNAHGLSALGLSLAKENLGPAAIIFSCLQDKEPETLIPHLRSLPPAPIFVPPIKDNPRAMDPAKLASLIGLNAVATSSLEQALSLAAQTRAERLPESLTAPGYPYPVLICGSLYLLAEFYALRPDCLEPEK